MKSNIISCKIKDVAMLGDGAHTKVKRLENGIKYLSSKNIKKGKIDYSDIDYISQEDYERLFSPSDNSVRNIRENDILYSIIGTIGNNYLYKKEDKFGISSSVAIIRPNTEKITPLYLYYYLQSKEFKKCALNKISSSVQGYLNLPMLSDIPIRFPQNINEQEKITKIFEKIDLKIGNNNKINDELKSMAKTIYDYWFTQFDFPNKEGTPYKSSGGEMVWNEKLKRKIPEAWILGKVSDCITGINTGLNPRDNFVLNTGVVKYITVKNISVDGYIDFINCDTVNVEAREIIHKRSDIAKGDILFASIVPLGRCCLLEEDPVGWDINESVFSIRPNFNNTSSEFLYMYLTSEMFIKKASHSSTGSIFQGIRINTLNDMLITIPTKDVVDKFTSKIHSILYAKDKNNQENQELTSLRDFLLSLLMNGQVGVKE